MADLPNPLGDDAAELIKESMTYMEVMGVEYDPVNDAHMMKVAPDHRVWLGDFDHWLDTRRNDLVERMVSLIMREVGQPQYSGNHGSRTGYVNGCRGLLCRRAHRVGVRNQQGMKANAKYEIADALLSEAESRILPDEVVGTVVFADRVARVS